MTPTNKQRLSYLKLAGGAITGKVFLLVGLPILIIGSIMTLLMLLLTLKDLIQGEEINFLFLTVCGFILIFGVMFTLFGKLGDGIKKSIWNSTEWYKPNLNKVSKMEVLDMAYNKNCPLNACVEVNEDWIDFHFTVENSIETGTGAYYKASQELIGAEFGSNIDLSVFGGTNALSKVAIVYSKMYKVLDNYKVKELDAYEVKALNAGFGAFSATGVRKYGHFMYKFSKSSLGLNLNNNNVGINNYSLDTVEMTNIIHKWFADMGYVIEW